MKITEEDKKSFWWAVKVAVLKPLVFGMGIIHLIRSVYLGVTTSAMQCLDCWLDEILLFLQKWHISSDDAIYIAMVGYAATIYTEYKHALKTGRLG